ncbi:MAG: ATP synthase gamma chain [Cyclobacteriaceae bacterium]|nr:MAG: ATP synthase gamma chain [Cyclobacteriaceae bacterium]
MPSLKEVKSRIASVSSTQQITKAMKMVAAAKLRKAQNHIIQMRPYSKKLSDILFNVSTGGDVDMVNPYAEDRPVKRVLLVAITSDKGLCGPFNSNVIKTTNQLIDHEFSEVRDADNLIIMPIGKRALEYYRRRKARLIGDYAKLFVDLSFEQARIAAEHAMNEFLEEKFDRVILVYNEFKNVATQVLRAEQLLPMIPSDDQQQQEVVAADYIYEPSKTEILEDLIPKSIKLKFYTALLESHASEHGARMTAMDKATENAGELLRDLRLTYNRTRQAAITKEILEIVAGAEALSGN